ncbi:MAG: bifunctional nuclease family protein [Opitutales bacterium]|nr:bifunctional nuclease family protein [Opitutales bacterium]
MRVVEASIKGVMPTTNGCALFLGPPDLTFIIYVDQYIGNTIQMALNGVTKERPLTHDLMVNMLSGLGVHLDRIIINDREEDTFYARIFLKMENELGTKVLELDSRPSDAISLALQMKRPIYVVQSVLDGVEDMTELLERILEEGEETEEEDNL